MAKKARMSEEELVRYEAKAIAGLAEMLPTMYEEVGLGGLMGSLFEIVRQCDDVAMTAKSTKPDSREARQLAATWLRMMHIEQQKVPVLEAVQLASGQKAA